MFHIVRVTSLADDNNPDVRAEVDGFYRFASQLKVFIDILKRHGPGSKACKAFRLEHENDHRFQDAADHAELMARFERGEVDESDPKIANYLKNLDEFHRLRGDEGREDWRGR